MDALKCGRGLAEVMQRHCAVSRRRRSGRLVDVFDTPLLVLLVLVGVRTHLGVVVVTLAGDVQHLASGTVSDGAAFHRPLLVRTAVVRLQTNSVARFYNAQPTLPLSRLVVIG